MPAQSSRACSKGSIKRKAYSYKKKSKKIIRVKSSCVKDMGKPGKGPKLIIMPKEDTGLLSKYGYKLSKPYEDRVKCLKKAINDIDRLKVLRHINALRTLFKSNEKYYNKLNKDLKWIQNHY